jgi:crotonobetainyl-CoA:carnitine CoA-transferase CaiB-like acyl-CoA transferase
MSDARPLDGIRILSLAQQLPGPYCSLLLSDLGAEVILIEQIPRGDPARMAKAIFEQVNRGKRSVALDLKSERGREAFYRLVRTADAILEGFRPGVAERLGVDYSALKTLRPDLIYCSISGYGQDGPDRLASGHDISYQARAGAVPIDNGVPQPASLPVADFSSGMFAALTVTAALLERARGTGQGRLIDISMAESMLSWNTVAIAAASEQRSDSKKQPGREPAYGMFRTLDGWVTLSIAHEDHFWKPLCEALGRPDFAKLGGLERGQRSAELRSWISKSLAEESSGHWLSTLTERNVAIGRVNSPTQAMNDPVFTARGNFPRIGETTYVMPPMRFEGKLAPVGGPAPALGENTREYLKQVGYSDGEIAALRQAGAVMFDSRGR